MAEPVGNADVSVSGNRRPTTSAEIATMRPRRFRGPFASLRYLRWAQRQAALARLQRMMDENNARLADIREARKCRLCEALDD